MAEQDTELLPKPEEKNSSNSTVDAAVTCRLILCAVAAAFGSVHFGWNTGVINNPKASITDFLNSSTQSRYGTQLSDYSLELLWSACVSIFAIGGMAGALAGGHFAELVGRQRALLCNSGLGLIAALISGLSAVCNSPEMLIFGRLVTGVCSAVFTCIVPLYISELAPNQVRGAFGVLHQLGVVIGLLLSQILSMPFLLGSSELWPLSLAGGAVCCLLQLVLLPLCPESPRYLLLTRNSLEAARVALEKLRGVESDLDAELQEIERERTCSSSSSSSSSSSIVEFFRTRQLLIPLIIGVLLHLSQQLSGINVIFYYSSELFRLAGASDSGAAFGTVATGGVLVAMTVVSVPLMEAAGRRTLHLVGLLFILISSTAFTAVFFAHSRQAEGNSIPALTYSSIVFAVLIVVAFAIGPGSIPWLMVSELFGQRHRSTANAVCVLVNWLANFCVGLLFPVLAKGLGPLLFVPFSAITAVLLVLLFKLMPETKGKTIDEVAAGFKS